MKNRNGLENNDNWQTPEWLYKELDDKYHFDFDPCPLNHDVSKWDGLAVEWALRNYCNPPYNRVDKPKFIHKAFEEWQKGKLIVMLIPVATSTNDFHDYIKPYANIEFLRGRVAFKGYNSKGEYVTNKKGMHDSMIVIFRGRKWLRLWLKIKTLPAAFFEMFRYEKRDLNPPRTPLAAHPRHRWQAEQC